MRFKVLCCIALVLGLAGCATSGRGMSDIKTQQLEMRIKQLEKDVQLRDKKIYELESKNVYIGKPTARHGQTMIYPEKTAAPTRSASDASNATPKKIQSALKKAGFYSGQVDGKIGKNTKKAIKEFQAANGLKADGAVGEKTWAKLERYLD